MNHVCALLDGYCSTVQDALDWIEVDLGFTNLRLFILIYVLSVFSSPMGWLLSVGSIKLYVSFAEYCLFNRALLQKRPVILSFLQTEATPYNLLLLSSCPFWTSCTASRARWECLKSQPSILSVAWVLVGPLLLITWSE